MIAPFCWYDADPYLVVSGGRLVWLQDAYTFTDRYPYSTPAANDVNYIRNAVKVAVDAYDGTTTFYLADPKDPIAATYQRHLSVALPPPQRDARGHAPARPLSGSAVRDPDRRCTPTFHMTNPAVFYNKEDQWDVPAIEGSEAQPERMEPYTRS